ncbi:hypothetical protein [Ketobacter alkanivorans]|uniref:hypothetical protein n=1 Tax=Ketobacter alkanivorans TaxID=1917421 RepID=UPI001F40AAC4|nr:hypothetical protein [Ketobacter alkanivorans]
MRSRVVLVALILPWLTVSAVQAGDWDFELGAEYRYLPQNPPYGVGDDAASVSVRGEYVHDWNDGADLFQFEAFYRWSEADDERTHGDIQDLAWIHVADDWELRSGVRTVFWGVTEFQHLVDIVNQSDLVERTDGEAKLGQPMINLSLVSDWGIVDLFALVGFRERTFPGEDGWPRGPLVISSDDADYESGAEDKRVDIAARWSTSIEAWELALSYFGGTSRDPEFRRINAQGEPVPFYPVIDQFGLELQYNYDAWLLKMEALNRSGTESGRYFATVFGFEYTLEGLFDGVSDLGIVSEYNYDERGKESPSSYYLENDIALGLRWALNDEASTEMLGGIIYDHKTNERVFSLEASRRLGDVWMVSLDALFFHSKTPPSQDDLANGSFDPLYKLAQSSRNDLLQLELIRYF